MCGESLESTWDADAEEWRLRGALAVLTPSNEADSNATAGGRVLYHATCFDPSSLPPPPPAQGATVASSQPVESAKPAVATAGATAAQTQSAAPASFTSTNDPNALLMQILAGLRK